MIFRRTDRAFEEAARDPAQLEALLRRLRRVRAGAFVVSLIMILGLIGLFAWFVWDAWTLLQAPIFDPSKSTLVGGAVSSGVFGGGLIAYVAFLFGAVSGMLDVDGRIKMLLMIRAARDGVSPGALKVEANR